MTSPRIDFARLCVLFFLLVVGHVCGQQKYEALGSFSVDYPAFLNLGYFTPENRDAHIVTMIITCFSGSFFNTDDAVYIVEDIGNYLSNLSSVKPMLVTKDLVWPNEATPVPFEIFKEAVLGLGNGFLVPGKTTGSVSIIPYNTSTPHSISKPKNNWFYHVAKWWDMDGDGLIDCLSARATVPMFGGSPQGELVWFSNPGVNAFTQVWEEHVIASGPDIIIDLIWIDGEQNTTQPQIVATEFFSEALTLWWTENDSLWSDESKIQSRVIDNQLGAPFDVQFVDLNNDGKKDLLVTNHQGAANESAVFAYTVPANWKTDPWPRYVLATNITTLKEGPNQASPGRATAFHPNTKQTNSKPQIIVGGDGAEIAFMLYPVSEDVNNWTYTRQDIIYTGCTVGQVVVGDVNGDSWVEFFVPAYEDNTVYGFTYGSVPNE